MCMGGGPKMPSMPDPPPPAPTPPPPAPMIEPELPTPPPTNVTDGNDNPKVKKRTSKRMQQQQASQGANALRIPLNTGSASPAGKKPSALNIPT